MKSLKLVYFERCPNAEKAKELLRKIGVDFTEINQDSLETHDPFQGYTSPTLLIGTEIIFGSKTTDLSGGCSLNLPSFEELRTLLRKKD